MQEQEIELSIGDSLQVGQHFVTIVRIDDGIVSLRIEHEMDVREFSIGDFDEIDEALRR